MNDRIAFTLHHPNGEIEQYTASCTRRLEAIPQLAAGPVPRRRSWEQRAAQGSLVASQQLAGMERTVGR